MSRMILIYFWLNWFALKRVLQQKWSNFSIFYRRLFICSLHGGILFKFRKFSIILLVLNQRIKLYQIWNDFNWIDREASKMNWYVRFILNHFFNWPPHNKMHFNFDKFDINWILSSRWIKLLKSHKIWLWSEQKNTFNLSFCWKLSKFHIILLLIN